MSNIRIKESQLRLLEDYVSDNRLERIGDEKAELENDTLTVTDIYDGDNFKIEVFNGRSKRDSLWGDKAFFTDEYTYLIRNENKAFYINQSVFDFGDERDEYTIDKEIFDAAMFNLGLYSLK